MKSHSVLGVSLVFALACGGGDYPEPVGAAPMPGDPTVVAPAGSQWWCHASGSWEECTDDGQWKRCQEKVSEGQGLSPDRMTSENDAVQMCASHAINMMITANMGNGSGSLKQTCAVYKCQQTDG